MNGQTFAQNGGTAALMGVRDLKVYFQGRSGWLRRQVETTKLLDGVSFDVHQGETLLLVGDAGSGKTTIARALLQLMTPSSGTILFRGQDITGMDRQQKREWRRQVQLILQDSYRALNPALPVAELLREPLEIHALLRPTGQEEQLTALLETVGLNPYYARRRPPEFSGMVRMRLNLARALATGPQLLVLDDPLGKLDTAVQPRLLALLQRLKEQHNLTYLLFARDQAPLADLVDRSIILKHGRIP